jgi:DNA-binding response OmpR family regulator/HPt (histidine-containing phosphotransfer) domain-containing protein
MTHQLNVLVVEDSLDSLQAIELVLKDVCQIFFATKISQAKQMLELHNFSLIILDIQLPDGDGLTFYEEANLAATQNKAPMCPVMFLTGTNELSSKIAAFESGAMDYIVKPFVPVEFRARVVAQLNRGLASQAHAQNMAAQQEELHNFRMDHSTQTVSFESFGRNRTIPVTSLEYRILKQLISAEGKLVAREELLNTVWGGKVSVSLRTIDTHICHLRTKLKGAPISIVGVKGKGYTLTQTEVTDTSSQSFVSNFNLINLGTIEAWKKIDAECQKLREMIQALMTQEITFLNEVRGATDPKALASLKSTLHQLKSSTKQLGAQALAQACVDLEHRIKMKIEFDQNQEAEEFSSLWKNTRICFQSLGMC